MNHEQEKLAAFGSWLTAKKIQFGGDLYQLSLNAKAPMDAIRIKAGHLEAANQILEAFSLLYKEPLEKFMVNYMGAKEEEESDG